MGNKSTQIIAAGLLATLGANMVLESSDMIVPKQPHEAVINHQATNGIVSRVAYNSMVTVGTAPLNIQVSDSIKVGEYVNVQLTS